MELLNLNGEIPMNCYIISSNKECYIVDPGFQKERIINHIKDMDYKVLGILLTHAHFDHIGALDCFDVPIYISKKEIQILKDNSKNGCNMFGKSLNYDTNKLNLSIIKTNDIIKFSSGETIEVFETPGHTSGCVVYKHKNDLYSGDTLFNSSVGRWDLPTGSLEVLSKTIVNLLDNFDENTKVYPAHGLPTTIKDEKRNNQFYLKYKNNPM